MQGTIVPDGERRLAAIMFTDISGYTRLTQENESETVRLLEDHRRLLRPILSSHGGREVKTMGDAFLVEFGSALEAVLCAVAVQSAINDRKLARGETLAIRIGIHVGDVIEREGDVLGDAVNIASRIEPLAEPGGVCVSEEIYVQVKNKLPYCLVKIGARELKNVLEPVVIYKVALPWEQHQGADASAAPLDQSRIAVIPFANMSPDPNDEYFADGMTEELIDRLAQVKGIEVIARTSVMNYKGEKKNASQIGRELRAGALIEGSVRKAGNRIRVTAQLVNANTEGHLWSSHYDGNLDDIFSVQSEIAERVAEELKVRLLRSERTALEKKATEDTEAYTCFLRGMQLVHQLGEEPLRNALSLFEHALARDPRFARAQAGIAVCYLWLANWGYLTFREGIDKGRAAALEALELDPGLAEAHYSMALAMFLADEDEGCVRELRKAIELNPNLSDAYVLMADSSASLGDTQEMVRAAEKAYQLDPLSPNAIMWLGLAYFFTGRGDEAAEHWNKTIILEPYRAHRFMFDYYVSRGEYGEAEKTVKELEKLGPTLAPTYLNRGYLAALTGDVKTAQEMIAKLDKGAGWGGASQAGFIYYALGDMDKFFEYMFRAAENHTMGAQTLRYSPLFDKARKDPRMVEVFRKAGLTYVPSAGR
jgi:adenylate cyclase